MMWLRLHQLVLQIFIIMFRYELQFVDLIARIQQAIAYLIINHLPYQRLNFASILEVDSLEWQRNLTFNRLQAQTIVDSAHDLTHFD